MRGSGSSGNVDVFAYLDEAVGAQDRHPPVAPRAQPAGGKPVDTEVAGSTVAAYQRVPEVVELGLLRVGEITDLRRHDLALGGPGEVKEVVGLVRADVDQNSAVAFALIEPRRAMVRPQAMRAQADG